MTEMTYKDVSERTLYISLPKTKGLRIKGILRGSLDKPVIVMMHGRPGTGNSLLQYLGSRYLYEHGFSSLRLFMYDFDLNTRDLLDCTLQTHADDFDCVVSYLKKCKVPQIFAVGHSYGGATILLSKSKLDSAVLWDPTHGLYWTENRGKGYDMKSREMLVGNINIGQSGPGYITSKAIVDYDHSVGDTTKWAVGKGYPLKVIGAGKGVMADLVKKYIDVADAPKKYVLIKDAGHSFYDSDKVTLQLFEETANWFKNGR